MVYKINISRFSILLFFFAIFALCCQTCFSNGDSKSHLDMLDKDYFYVCSANTWIMLNKEFITEGIEVSYYDDVQDKIKNGLISEAYVLRKELRLIYLKLEDFFISQTGRPPAYLTKLTVPSNDGNSGIKTLFHFQKMMLEQISLGKSSKALEMLDTLHLFLCKVNKLFDF